MNGRVQYAFKGWTGIVPVLLTAEQCATESRAAKAKWRTTRPTITATRHLSFYTRPLVSLRLETPRPSQQPAQPSIVPSSTCRRFKPSLLHVWGSLCFAAFKVQPGVVTSAPWWFFCSLIPLESAGARCNPKCRSISAVQYVKISFGHVSPPTCSRPRVN